MSDTVLIKKLADAADIIIEWDFLIDTLTYLVSMSSHWHGVIRRKYNSTWYDTEEAMKEDIIRNTFSDLMYLINDKFYKFKMGEEK